MFWGAFRSPGLVRGNAVRAPAGTGWRSPCRRPGRPSGSSCRGPSPCRGWWRRRQRAPSRPPPPRPRSSRAAARARSPAGSRTALQFGRRGEGGGLVSRVGDSRPRARKLTSSRLPQVLLGQPVRSRGRGPARDHRQGPCPREVAGKKRRGSHLSSPARALPCHLRRFWTFSLYDVSLPRAHAPKFSYMKLKDLSPKDRS